MPLFAHCPSLTIIYLSLLVSLSGKDATNEVSLDMSVGNAANNSVISLFAWGEI